MLFAWSVLATAIASEIAATLSLKAAGNGSVPAIAIVVVGYAASVGLLMLALKRIDVSIAYAAWAGTGTAVVALLGMTLLGESASGLKVASVALVIAGVVGLNLGGAH